MNTNSDPLISIIVPIYNVESYLTRCINSICCQSYPNIEIILVNDGSTDTSLKIVRHFAEKDPRIIVIDKLNGGLSDARNAGLDIASGEYTVFIDSDDYAHLEYVERLYKLAKQYDADIVTAEFIEFSENSRVKSNDRIKKQLKEFSSIEAIQNMWYQKEIHNNAWGKIYRSVLFADVRYPVGMIYEDLATTYKLLSKANKVLYSSDKLYYYLRRQNGIMNSNFSIKKMDRIKASQNILEWAKEFYPEAELAAISRYFVSNVQVLREIPMKKEYSEQIDEIWENIKKYRNTVICDKNAKLMNRVIALASYIGCRNLSRLGAVYKFIWK